MFNGIHFAHAQYLYALLAVPPLALALSYVSYWLRMRARKVYGEEGLVNRYTRKPGKVGEILMAFAWAITLSLLVVAAAGPLRPDTPQRAQVGSLQVVVVMDVSWSMGAEDYRTTMTAPDGTPGTAISGPFGSRLDMSKDIIVNRMMPALQGNQIGVVTYMGNGFPQADLTDDYTALRFVVKNWITVGSAPGGGSDISEGLKDALDTFKRDEDPKKDKVIVLISDGGFTGKQEDLDAVLQKLSEQHVRMIIVGVGGDTPLPMPLYEKDGTPKGYRTKDGQVVSSAFESPALEAIKGQTGAEYIRVADAKDVNIQWASTLAGSKAEPHETHVYQYPLCAGLVILLLLSFRGLARQRDLV